MTEPKVQSNASSSDYSDAELANELRLQEEYAREQTIIQGEVIAPEPPVINASFASLDDPSIDLEGQQCIDPVVKAQVNLTNKHQEFTNQIAPAKPSLARSFAAALAGPLDSLISPLINAAIASRVTKTQTATADIPPAPAGGIYDEQAGISLPAVGVHDAVSGQSYSVDPRALVQSADGHLGIENEAEGISRSLGRGTGTRLIRYGDNVEAVHRETLAAETEAREIKQAQQALVAENHVSPAPEESGEIIARSATPPAKPKKKSEQQKPPRKPADKQREPYGVADNTAPISTPAQPARAEASPQAAPQATVTPMAAASQPVSRRESRNDNASRRSEERTTSPAQARRTEAAPAPEAAPLPAEANYAILSTDEEPTYYYEEFAEGIEGSLELPAFASLDLSLSEIVQHSPSPHAPSAVLTDDMAVLTPLTGALTLAARGRDGMPSHGLRAPLQMAAALEAKAYLYASNSLAKPLSNNNRGHALTALHREGSTQEAIINALKDQADLSAARLNNAQLHPAEIAAASPMASAQAGIQTAALRAESRLSDQVFSQIQAQPYHIGTQADAGGSFGGNQGQAQDPTQIAEFFLSATDKANSHPHLVTGSDPVISDTPVISRIRPSDFVSV